MALKVFACGIAVGYALAVSRNSDEVVQSLANCAVEVAKRWLEAQQTRCDYVCADYCYREPVATPGSGGGRGGVTL